MANKRGFEIIDGKAYLDGVEIQGGGGGGSTPVHNTFNKICIYGTSIEAYAPYWGATLAAKLGLTWRLSENSDLQYKTGVYGFGMGGGGVTWYGNGYPIAQNSVLWGQVNAAFSCTKAEKLAAMQYYLTNGIITQAMYDDITKETDSQGRPRQLRALKTSYDESILSDRYIDSDLFIIGTYGINDRHSFMTFDYHNKETRTIDGEQENVVVAKHASSFTVNDSQLWHAKDGVSPTYDQQQNCYRDLTQWEADKLTLCFDRRTIFGAYNYVLRELYRVRPDAKVVILGQHTFNWNGQKAVNSIQQMVAKAWQIPFADWGRHLPMNDMFSANGDVFSGVVNNSYLNSDAVHPAVHGCEYLGDWVAKWITETELTPLNPDPRYININEDIDEP